jgi:hypothetical protein
LPERTLVLKTFQVLTDVRPDRTVTADPDSSGAAGCIHVDRDDSTDARGAGGGAAAVSTARMIERGTRVATRLEGRN